MVIKTTAIWLHRVLWTLVVVVMLSIAAYVSLGRHYIGYVERQQEQILALLQERTGLRFSATSISGRWSQLAPTITVANFKLHDPIEANAVVLSASAIEFKVAVLESLVERTLNIDKLAIADLVIQAEEVELGQWRLRHLPSRGDTWKFDAILDTLLAVNLAQIDTAKIILHFNEGQRTELHSRQISLQRRGSFRRTAIELTIAERPAPLSLLIESHGDPRDEADFSADAFAAFQGVDFTPILPATRFSGVELGEAFIDGSVWISWRPGAEMDARGELRVPHVDMAGLTGKAIQPFTDLTLKFSARGTVGNWRGWVHSLNAQWAGQAINFDRLLVNANFADQSQFEFALASLDLAPVVDWVLDSGMIQEEFNFNALKTLAPRGLLRNVRIVLPLGQDKSAGFSLRGELDAVQVSPWRGAPGAQNVNGYVQVGLRDGFVELSTKDLLLSFPDVYRHDLHFARAQAHVAWRVNDDTVYVNSGPIRLWADDGDGPAVGLLALDLPHDKTVRDRTMTLMIGLQNSAAKYRDKYLPHFLSENLQAWLQRSIKAGAIKQGGFVYRGSVLPGDYADRSVQLFFDIDHGELEYQQAWPALHDVQARLWIDDGEVDVYSARARIFNDIDVSDVAVNVKPRPGVSSWLSVTGDVHGRNDDVLRVLRESPISKHIGTALASWHWRGSARAQLRLDLPLEGDDSAADINVAAELEGGNLTLPDYRFEFTDVRGPLHYSSAKGLSSAGITARWHDRLLDVAVSQKKNAVALAVNGLVEMRQLQDWLRSSTLVFAAGSTSVDVDIRIDKKAGSELLLRSDLVGVAIDLPPPFGKTAGEPRMLTLQMPLGIDMPVLNLRLGDQLQLAQHFGEKSVVSTSVRLGAGELAPIETGVINFSGGVDGIDVERWKSVLDVFLRNADTYSDTTPTVVRLNDLQLTAIDAWGYTIDRLQLTALQRADYWEFNGDSANFAGRLTLYTQQQKPPLLELSRLHLPAPGDDDTESRLAKTNPTELIDIDVTIAELHIGERQLGNLAFDMRSDARGLELQRLRGAINGMRLGSKQQAALYWWREATGDRSGLRARLNFDNFADVLRAYNYEAIIESRKGYADLDVHWPGNPEAFGVATLQGDAHLVLKDGRFLNTSSTATGALKVVGIFNFANLLRRLQLDFSDIYKSGLSYDKVKGSFHFDNGRLQVGDPLLIEGPGSRFSLSGHVDIVNDNTRLDLVATLPVATNLPWIVALAGGLPAAAGVYVASKLFEETVDKFSSAVYEISGPWSDPKIKFKKIFDDNVGESVQSPSIHDLESP